MTFKKFTSQMPWPEEAYPTRAEPRADISKAQRLHAFSLRAAATRLGPTPQARRQLEQAANLLDAPEGTEDAWFAALERGDLKTVLAGCACETCTTATGAPREFRIWAHGVISTSKGEFVFDADSARSVMQKWRTQGNDLPIDYDHKSLDPHCHAPSCGIAAGWFTPEVRNGELWATSVRWTDVAAEGIRKGEWRYFSPAFFTRGKRINSIINIAITNLPSTKNMTPLTPLLASCSPQAK